MTLPFLFLYNFTRVPLYLLIKIAGFFNAKIRMTLAGRRGLFKKLQSQVEQIPVGSKRLWIHISSMGEFEQGIPLIEELLYRFPNAWIVVSLFSPSAYNHLNFTRDRTILTYLPFDTPRNAARFVSIVNPSIHVIIRHDIWPNFQRILQKRKIPSLLVNASFSEKSLKWVKRLKSLYSQIYATFSAICVVSELNKERVVIVADPQKIITCGDTRYDRVYARAMDTQKIDFLRSLNIKRDKCLVIGSSWPEDEKVILPGILKTLKNNNDFFAIIAPHEISNGHLQHLENHFAQINIPATRLSFYKEHPVSGVRVILVDSIGLLANLYSLGLVAYVGGGFGAGVHSVLEPAAHGAVVCYGPLHLNSPEAKEMTELKIGIPIAQESEFQNVLLTMLNEPDSVAEKGVKTKDYVLRNVGASRRTADVIQEFLDHH